MPSSPSPRSSPAPQVNRQVETQARNSASFVPAWRRPTLAQPNTDSGRRPSVQFVPQVKTDGANSRPTSRSSSAQPTAREKRPPLAPPGGTKDGRRLSSPPPPAQFRPSVGFDTFNNKEASDFSLTLNRKHRDYEYTKRSRTFLCGTDTNDYSDTALEWLIDELVDDGDEVVCLRVVEKDSKEALKWSGGMGEKGYKREANRFLESIEKKNTEDRAISLILEFSIGKVNDTIQHMIKIYEPAILVVGTRGKSLTGYQGLLSSGSVSKYCLQYSPVPVIVVRPSSKREAKKKKRLQDPSRTGYRDILDKSDEAPRGQGWHLLDKQNRLSVVGSDFGALGQLDSAGDPDHEARMVAEAIGYRGGPAQPRSLTPLGQQRRESSLSRVTSATSATSEGSMGSPQGGILKSPEIGVLDSPPDSEDELNLASDEETRSPPAEVVRPEDEAAMLAYERALKVVEEEKEADVERARREAERSASRGRRPTGARSASRGQKDDNSEGGGAAVLGLLAQLDRGMK